MVFENFKKKTSSDIKPNQYVYDDISDFQSYQAPL